MDEVEVYVEQIGLWAAVAGPDDVAFPDLFRQGVGGHGSAAHRYDRNGEHATVRSFVADRLADASPHERLAEG